jgi:hypothetical protein
MSGNGLLNGSRRRSVTEKRGIHHIGDEGLCGVDRLSLVLAAGREVGGDLSVSIRVKSGSACDHRGYGPTALGPRD